MFGFGLGLLVCLGCHVLVLHGNGMGWGGACAFESPFWDCGVLWFIVSVSCVYYYEEPGECVGL